MRRTRVLLLSAAVLGGSVVVAQGAGPVAPVDPKIEGWGPFKFGMTLRDVRELNVLPITWGTVQNYDYRIATLKARRPVAAFGSTYGLSLHFGWGQRLFARDKKLSEIGLSSSNATSQDLPSCERNFQTAVLKLETYYGPLTTTETPKKGTGSLPGETFEVTLVRIGRSVYARGETVSRWSRNDPLQRVFRFVAGRSAEGKVSLEGKFVWTTRYKYEGGPGWAPYCDVFIKIEGMAPANILN